MANLEEYANRVKNLKTSDVKQEFLGVIVRSESISASFNLIKANDLSVDGFLNNYYVTQRLVKDAEKEGFRDMKALVIIAYGALTAKHLATEINKKYLSGNKTWDKSNVTVKQVAILNLGEHLNFFLNYSELVLDVAITNTSSGLEPGKYLNKHDTNFLTNSLKLQHHYQ